MKEKEIDKTQPKSESVTGGGLDNRIDGSVSPDFMRSPDQAGTAINRKSAS